MSGSARTADHFGFTSTFGIYTDLSFLFVISGICQFPETTPLRRNFVF